MAGWVGNERATLPLALLNVLATGDELVAPVSRRCWGLVPLLAAADADVAVACETGVVEAEDAVPDDEVVAGETVGTFDVTVEMVWHAVEVVVPNRPDGDEDVLPQPAAFALPAVTHQSAIAPSAMATAQMATESDPPRDTRMPIPHVNTPRVSAVTREMGASVRSNCAGEAAHAAGVVPLQQS